MERSNLRDPYTEVATGRQRGQTIQQIFDDVGHQLGISRSEVGRLAKKWKVEEEDKKKQMQLVDWGKMTDVDWGGIASSIVPIEAVPFLLQVEGPELTVAEARFCWKVKQAAPDIPPGHAQPLMHLFRSRFPLELRGEEVDYSDILHYLASHRWASRDEDIRYLDGVALGGWPALHPTPPNRREGEHDHRVRLAHNNLHKFIWLELDPLDERYHPLWEDIGTFLVFLPWTPPWDPRVVVHQAGVLRNRANNKDRLEGRLELDQESAEERKGSDS